MEETSSFIINEQFIIAFKIMGYKFVFDQSTIYRAAAFYRFLSRWNLWRLRSHDRFVVFGLTTETRVFPVSIGRPFEGPSAGFSEIGDAAKRSFPIG